jgi:hypothetical protein
MHDHDSVTNHAPYTTHGDKAVQRALLALVLTEHPMHLTKSQLSQELSHERPSSPCGEAIALAIRDLTKGGLLQCNGALVVPTRAALYFNELNH